MLMEETVQQCIVYEKELSAALTDLSSFEDTIYTQHLRIDLGSADAGGTASGIESVKSRLDEMAIRVREQLSQVDRICAEQADSLTPEQFAVLRQKRDELANNYETAVRNVEIIYERLHEITRLLIVFSTSSSSTQSWITEMTREIGDVRRVSSDPKNLEEQRRRARQLQEEVMRGEDRLKNISSIVLKIDGEISDMHSSVTNVDLSGLSADEVKQTMYRVEDDYAELKRMLQDLSAFQSRVADHENDVYKHGDEAISWLNGLEDQVRSLQNKKDIPVEERLQLTEELNRQAATEQGLLDNTDRASERLLSVLEGTPAYEDVKERLEREQKERRRRHQSVQDEMQRAVSDAISEKAVNEGVRDAVDGLLDWAMNFERTATGQSHPIPLREEKLMELKNEEQRMRGEAEARQALAKQLEQEVRKVSITSPNAARTEKLEEKLADAAGRLNRANGALRGYRDNVDDALNGVRDLNKKCDVIGRRCDELSSHMKNIPAKDQSRLEEAQAALAAIGGEMMEAEKLANMLLSLPDATHTEEIDGRMSLLGGQIDDIADQLEEKKKKAVEVGNLEGEYEEKRDRVAEIMGKLNEKLTSIGNPGASSDKLTGQRQQLAEAAGDYQNVLPLLQELEELSFKLAEAQTVPGSRASSVPKNAMDLKAKSDQIGELIEKQDGKLAAQQAKVCEFEGLKEDLDRWIREKEEQMGTDIQIDPLNRENISSANGKLDKLAKEARGQQRRVEDVRVLARELARSCPEDAPLISDMEKGVSEKWDEFNNEMDKGKQRTESAEKMVDGVSQLDRWLSGKQRMLLAIGAPSTDPSVAKGQQNQLQMLRVDAENEIQTLDKLAELAEKLIEDAPTEKEKEAIRKKLDEVTQRWSALGTSLDEKEAAVGQAAALGASIAGLQKEIKKELSELEDSVEKASRLLPSDIDRKLAVLDECKSRGRLDALLEQLKEKLGETEGVEIDQSAKSEMVDVVNKLHMRAEEVDTKIDSVKRAALSAHEEGGMVERQLDALLESMRDAGLEVFNAVPLCADQTKLKDQTEHFDKVYGSVLAKEGDVYLVRAKAQDQLMQMPNAELRSKLDRLNTEWPALLEATKGRKTALDRVKDLVEQFVEAEVNLADKIKEDMNAVQEAINIASPSESVDALRQLEGTVERRKQQAEGLEALANKIEQLAPGPDARHLKRQAENLTDDVNGLVKKSKNGLQNAQKKNEVRDKFDRAADEAYAFCAARESELDRDTDNISRERLGAKLSDTESFISRVGRQLSQLGDELKQIVPAEEAEQVEETRQEVEGLFENLMEKMRFLDSQLQGKKEEEEKLKEKAQELGTRTTDLAAEIEDLDPIAMSEDDLIKQREQCALLADNLDQLESELVDMEREWNEAVEDGTVPREQLSAQMKQMADMKKVIAKGKKKLDERNRKIKAKEEDVSKLNGDATSVVEELNALLASDALQRKASFNDPKATVEDIRQVKDRMRPLAEKVDGVVADCKVLIKNASPDADTASLAKALSDVTSAWATLNAAVSDKQIEVDAVVQQVGNYHDAQKALLNWLEETEELVDNQKPPSGDPKVSRAQLQSYDVLLKHIEDKQASVDGFGSMIDKLCEMATSDEEKKGLKGKAENISARFDDLLETAHQKQARLRDATDMAEKLGREMEPFKGWLNTTEKRIAQLGNVATSSDVLADQLKEVEVLQGDIAAREANVNKLMMLGPQLAALISIEDANELEADLTAATTKYGSLGNRADQCKEVLEAMEMQINDFEEDIHTLAEWLDAIERDMSSLDELPINPEELLEQTNLLSELVEAVTERDALVSSVVRVGKTLGKAASAEDALALQAKVEGLRTRYVDVAAYADEKLAQLSKAIPLSERFHDGIEAVMEWVEAVEEDLRVIDTVDLDTQQQLIQSVEDDVAEWRPEVDELVIISTQLQQLAGPERADELHSHTQEMSRRVNQIADQVGRRAERLDLTERHSRAVVDELDFVLEWLADARERVMAAPPLAIDPDYLKAQLRNQKLLNEDLAMQKARLRDATAECRKVARQIGSDGGQDAALLQKGDAAKDLADEVVALCTERTEVLEQAFALAEQIGTAFEDLNEWLDQVEDELSQQPAVTTATSPSELNRQQQHNMELSGLIGAQRPLVERFQKDVGALAELVSHEDAVCLDQISEQIVGRFHDVQDAVKARGEGIESILDATEAFGDRLDVFLATLKGTAESLRQPTVVSADPGLLQNRIAENEALLESLRDKEAALEAMKDRAHDLLAHAPPGDPAAAEVAAKIQALQQLWDEIGQGAQMRGTFLADALTKANSFWTELDNCQKACDDLKARLDRVEPVIGHPEKIREQQEEMREIGHHVAATEPRIRDLRSAGAELSAIIPEEEKAAVEQQMDMVEDGWNTITKLFADKNFNLGKAMDEAMQFHDDLSALNEFLDHANGRLVAIGATDKLPMEMIQPKLDEIQAFRAEIDDHAVLKEQVNQTAQGLIVGAPSHQTGPLRDAVAELNGKWSRLYGDIADKEHKIERAMLEMGRLDEAVDQVVTWMDKTGDTLGELAGTTPNNLRQIEIQQCKLAVLTNDVHAHEPSINSINNAADKLAKAQGSNGGEVAGKVQTMNDKWKKLNDELRKISSGLDQAKSAAEDVGGEMERWLAYVEDVETQLRTTKPTGGLPETAQQQMDDFHVLKAEVEQNTPALETHVRATEEYLSDHSEDSESWIGKNQQKLKAKWMRCKELLRDREKKLSLALDDAVALEQSMKDTTSWLAVTEDAIAHFQMVGRLPETLDAQLEEHRKLVDDVGLRRGMVAEMQANGTRMQYYCEKKDAIPIKNGLVSLRHRFEKVQARVNERGKQLDTARVETDAWLDGLNDLLFWLDELAVRSGSSDLNSSSQQKLREKLQEAKDLQRELNSKRPQYDTTRKRGQSVKEHAPKGERKTIEKKNEELRERWEETERSVQEKHADVESAVLESGAFEEAISELEAWIDAQLLDSEAEGEMGERVYGDVDTVRGLVDDEKKRAVERAAKKKGLEKILKKADDLMSRDVQEKGEVEKARKRLADKWDEVETNASGRSSILQDALKEAEDFDAKAHALLDWLASEEAKLKAAGQMPCEKGIEAVQAVLADLESESGRRDNCLSRGAEILNKAHPMAEQPLKHWNRVVAARWKEVEEGATARLAALQEEKEKRAEREDKLNTLMKFVAKKRDELQGMTSQPTPDDLQTVDDMLRQFEQLEFDLTEKQAEVDDVVQGCKKDKNPKGNELAEQWKQLWLDAIGHKNGLDDLRAVLDEMKRLEGWEWDDWKERYVEWNDHGKARVTDLFRRIDRTATGMVPRKLFIDAILNSKFPTTRLEMAKVADLFDKDGFINSKDFINALRFDKLRKAEPKTEHQKINEEISRQTKQCSCCASYKIEKISDGHYRFGDTQIKRMVRILRSTVMVRVGGGWEALDEFLNKHDPCRAKGRLNINMFYNDVRPINAVDRMGLFTKGRHARVPTGAPTAGTPGPIMKIREKTERSVPMFPGAGTSSAHSSTSRLRTPSDLSLSDSRIGRGGGSQSGSRASLAEGSGSRPPSRQSETSDRPTRIPSLRGKKGTRYNPPRQL